MNVYEIITIFDATLPDDALEEAVSRVEGLITKGGGEILKTDHWGKRKLAYEINKHSRGHYTLFLVQAPSSVNKTIEDFFKVYDPVVKFMIVRLEKKQRNHVLDSLKPAEEEAPAAAPEATEGE